MKSPELKQLCELVSDVAVSNATILQRTLLDILSPHSHTPNPEYILKTFAFMNWMIAQGIWSNLQNTQLRRYLQIELKDRLIINIAGNFTGSGRVEDIAGKAVFLEEYFNAYLMTCKHHMKNMSYADSGTDRLFALEQIQKKYQIGDAVMNDIVRQLWPDEKSKLEVESVAIQVNNIATEMRKPKGFLRRLFSS